MRRSFEKLAKASRTNIAGPIPVAQTRMFNALPPADRPQVHVVLMALFLSASALVATWLYPELAARATFLLCFVAVAGAGWYGGGLGGVVATVATTGGVMLMFLRGNGEAGFLTSSDALLLATFLMATLVVTWLNANLHAAARRLAGTEHLAHIVVDSAPILVAAADQHGNIALFNEACERVTGRTRDEVLGQPFVQTLVPMSWHSTVASRFSPDASIDLTTPHCNPWITRQGEERVIEWRCYQIPVGVDRWTVGVGIDVTDRKVIEEKLAISLERERAASNEAKAATVARERFIALLAHELRNPLHTVVQWAALMGRQMTEPQARSVSERIINNARLMSRLLEDVTDVARIGAGKVELNKVPLELVALLSDEVASFAPRADEKNVIVTIDSQGPTWVIADPHRVRQMLVNLLSNALRFAPHGSNIVVRIDVLDDVVTVAVEDQGPGFSVEPEKLFEPFWQGEGQTDGLGIGLALVSQLAEMHGGSVRATANPTGRGARVAFSIPSAPSTHSVRRA
jgi:PAS domain S-box-containing protein